MIHNLNNYEQQLLDGWEEVYKRGQLTLWIMLALQDGPKHMAAIKTFIEKQTNDMVTADNQSMYRALRRYSETQLVTYVNVQNVGGPDRKLYELTDTGRHVLEHFITRNLTGLVHDPIIKQFTQKEQV